MRRHCIEDLLADEVRCRAHVENSTAAATALIPALGYERVCEALRLAAERGQPVREFVVQQGWLTEAEFAALLTPEAVCRLGSDFKKAGG